MTPEGVKKLRAKAVLQDAASVGLAALGIREEEHPRVFKSRLRTGSIPPDTDEGIDVRIHGTPPPKEDAGYSSDSELDIRINRPPPVKNPNYRPRRKVYLNSIRDSLPPSMGGVLSFKPSGFGKGLKRDNDSSMINPTISKDNTRGECARQAELLAEFGKKKQPIGLAKAFVHMSLKPHAPQPFQEVEDDMEIFDVIPLASKM